MLKYIKKIFQRKGQNFLRALPIKENEQNPPIAPGTLLKLTIDYGFNNSQALNKKNIDFSKPIVFHEYIMYIETKTKKYLEFDPAYEHYFLNPHGKITSVIDDNEAFFVEDYLWLEEVLE